jgi:type II secretory pathway pseudopilin PulG
MNGIKIFNQGRKSVGFTLVELAIVFMIVGVVFLPLVAVIVQIDMDKKAEANVDRNDRAVAAINFYLKRMGRYPCPADPKLAPDHVNFGAEACTPVTGPFPGDVRIGALPTKTLGLPYHAAVNEDDWKHIYAVTDLLTDVALFDGTGDITIEYTAGEQLENVHFLIVNPGKDGKGVWTLYGDSYGASGLACGAAADSENCNGDAVFIDLALKTDMDSPTAAGYYDDILSYHVVSQKNDFWVPRKNAGAQGRVEIMNRVMGNVGFGVDSPKKKLEVDGGDTLVRGASNGGEVKASAGIGVGGTLLAQEIKVMNASGVIEAKTFCSGESFKNSGGAYECCTDNVYFEDSDTTEICGTDCPRGDVRDTVAGICCTVADYNGGTAGSCVP